MLIEEYNWKRGPGKNNDERWGREINRSFYTLCLHASNELIKKYGKSFDNAITNIYVTNYAQEMLRTIDEFIPKPESDDRFVDSFIGSIGRFHIYDATNSDNMDIVPNLSKTPDYAYLEYKVKNITTETYNVLINVEI